MDIKRQKDFVTSAKNTMHAIGNWDEDISTIDTFDVKLAEHLRTIQGSARNALAYMKSREV